MMLTPEFLEHIPDKMVELYAQAEADILSDMARRISTYNYYIPAAEHQMRKLEEMGLLRDEITDKLSGLTGKSRSELKDLMKLAGIETLKADDAIYMAAKLSPAPLMASPALKQILDAGYKKTSKLFENLTRTTANTATKQFEDALDRAHMQIITGAFDQNTAIRNTIKELAKQGVESVKYPSSHVDTIEVAVRRATQTGVNQSCLKLQDARADEMGCDLVETSAHSGARPSHAQWQGQIFSRGGNHPKYPPFSDTGYGSGEGLGGWNCKHSFYPFFEGISKRAYADKDLTDMNALNYEYNGKKMTEYEAVSNQRQIERNIRKWKRENLAMQAAGQDTAESAAKIVHWQGIQNDFLKQTGLKQQVDRTIVAGFEKSQAQKVVWVNKKLSGATVVADQFITNTKNIYTAWKSNDVKAFAEKMIKEAGINLPVQHHNIGRVFGQCQLSTKTGQMQVLTYELNSADKRSIEYKVKTAFHEAFHAKADGLAHGISGTFTFQDWAMIDDVFAECTAHYLTKQTGITEIIAPSYAGQLIQALPNLKKFSKEFMNCSTITDFGEVAYEFRFGAKRQADWQKVSSYVKANPIDILSYGQNYIDYIKQNKTALLDKMLEVRPNDKIFKPHMQIDLDNIISKYDNGSIKGATLTTKEETVFKEILINAMNAKGVI